MQSVRLRSKSYSIPQAKIDLSKLLEQKEEKDEKGKANWDKQLKNIINNPTFLTHIDRHIGENSTYTEKNNLKRSLQLIYNILTDNFPDVKIDNDGKIAIKLKLLEDIEQCTQGYHCRVSEILLSLVSNESLADLFYQIRYSLLKKAAYSLSNDVHVHNRVFVKAVELKLGVVPPQPNDPYLNHLIRQVPNDIIEMKLQATFHEYNPFANMLAVVKKLKEKIQNPAAEYSSQEARRLTEKFMEIDNEETEWDIYKCFNINILDQEKFEEGDIESYKITDVNLTGISLELFNNLLRLGYFKCAENTKILINKIIEQFIKNDRSQYEPLVPQFIQIFHNIQELKLFCMAFSLTNEITHYLYYRYFRSVFKKNDKNEIYECLTFLFEQNVSFDKSIFSGNFNMGNQMLIESAYFGDALLMEKLLSFNLNINFCDEEDANNTPLINAAKYGHIDIVNMLLKAKANVNLGDEHNNSALYWAAGRGHLAVVNVLLDQKGICLNQEGEFTPLMHACRYDHIEIVKALLKAGADIDFETSTNITAMKLATKRIQDLLNIQKVKEQNLFIAITKQDLDNIGHININCRNKNSDTLLIAAVKADRANNVDMLLAEGIDINLSNSGGTALHWAVSKNNIRIVKTLLKKKEININKKNINGITPLMYACKAGHLELLNILLEAEADINLLDYKENGILNWAVINGHVKVVEVLLKQKRINLNQQNREGLSPLMEASIKGDLHMVNILLKAGAVVNLLDNEGNNSLFHAINNGHIQIAEVLINQKVIHLNHQNNQKITSLMLACYKNNIEIVKCLLNAGADFKLRDNEKTTAYDLTDNTAIKDLIDLQKMKELSFFGIIRTKKLKQFKNININCRNENSETLLIAAAKAGRADNVSVLLKAGANVNLVDFNQDGALSWAADKGHNQVIEVLLEQKDINLNQANRQGSTPLMEACKKGHVGIAITLINAGANITLKNTKNETALQLCKSNSIKYILKCVAAVKTLEIKTDTQISKDVVSRKKSTYLFKALVRTIKSNKPNPEARINAILKVLYSRDESVITLVIEDLRKVKLLNRSKPTQQFFKSLFDKKSIYLSREQSDKCNACITKLQESLQQRYQVSLEQPINLEEKLGEETKRNNSPIPEQKVLSQTDSSCNRIIMLNKVPLAGIDNNAIYLTEDKESGEFTAHWHEEGRLQAHKLPLETISALENYFKPGETVEKGTSDFDEMLFLCGYRQRNRYSKIERLSQFALFSNGNHETSPSLQPPPAPKSVSFLESII